MPNNDRVLPIVVVMGVSGSGKTTVGAALAGLIGVDFEDGDDLHPKSNVDKMPAGLGWTGAGPRSPRPRGPTAASGAPARP